MHEGDDEIVVRADEPRDLFRTREFDPFAGDPASLWTIAQVAELGATPSALARMTLRILLPRDHVSPDSVAIVRSAIQRYCAHRIAEAKVGLLVWRRVAWRAFFIGFGFFVLSLAATAGVQHAGFLPEEIRTIAAETFVIAGWIFMWQPLDDLIQGWFPIRERERTFKAIGAMRLVVDAAD